MCPNGKTGVFLEACIRILYYPIIFGPNHDSATSFAYCAGNMGKRMARKKKKTKERLVFGMLQKEMTRTPAWYVAMTMELVRFAF